MKDRMEQKDLADGILADRALADRAFAQLDSPARNPGFEAMLLASYDGWSAGRRRGLAAGLAGALRGLATTIWPGAPAWVPAGVFAAALLIGVGLGVALPGPEQRMAFSLERAPTFSLLNEEDS